MAPKKSTFQKLGEALGMGKQAEDQYDPDEFQRIKQRVTQIRSSNAVLKKMQNSFADMYWMGDANGEAGERATKFNGEAWDAADLRETRSPSSRNQVAGLHRMLRTSKPQFKMKSDAGADVDDLIEDSLDQWWKASSARKRVDTHSDLSLSAIITGDADLEVKCIDDMLNIPTIPEVRKTRLAALRVRTPFIYDAVNALTRYPVWGEEGMSEWVAITKTKGRKLKEAWGERASVEDNGDYTYVEYWNLKDRCSYIEEQSDRPLRMGPHNMPDIPCFSAVADGTELFEEEHRKRQPFLYGIYKSGLDIREDELLTTIFTSVFSRGTGPLALLDPESVKNGINIRYDGPFRYIVGKGTFADDTAFDRNMINLKAMIDQLGQQSTINSQTLGENIEPGTPFSGYAMASQNGRVPLIPIQQACEKVIRDAAEYCLRYMKQFQISWGEITPAMIPDKFDLTVELQVDLPQDQLRMAKIASELGDKVSVEWMHENLLQIHDSNKMMGDIMTEKVVAAAFTQNLPTLMQKMMATMGEVPTPPTDTEVPTIPGGGMAGQIQGGPPAEVPGAGGVEMTEALPPGMQGVA